MQGSAREPREQVLRALLDAVGDGLLLGRAGRVMWANAALAALAGLDSGEKLQGKPFEELFRDAGQGLPGPDLERPVACRLACAEGEPRAVVVERLPNAGAAGESAFVVRDVTERRALEAEIVQLGRGLHEAQRERVELRERLREQSSRREELLTVVSHELRTPVTVIAGYNRLLLSGKVGALNEQQRHFVSESQKSCQRLNSFIANLLETSRGLAGEEALEARDAPLRATIEGVVEMLEPLLRDHQLTVRLDLDAAVPRAHFDPPRIEQVLTNLIGNAIKFTPRGGHIELSTRRLAAEAGGMVEVAVADDGPGVAPQDRERIFEAYVQAGPGRAAAGLGLGLAICRGIVAAHGGSIKLTERPGGGSRFAFTLPAAEKPAGEGA